jgi:hypothetical protein
MRRLYSACGVAATPRLQLSDVGEITPVIAIDRANPCAQFAPRRRPAPQPSDREVIIVKALNHRLQMPLVAVIACAGRFRD